VSASEVIAELPKLSRTERRQLAVAIFELEEEVDLLRDSDRRADERFRMLDVMEDRRCDSILLEKFNDVRDPRGKSAKRRTA
jgi:hypothetical protein